MKYELKFEIPYRLDAYESVTLQERFEREINSFLQEKKANVLYLSEVY